MDLSSLKLWMKLSVVVATKEYTVHHRGKFITLHSNYLFIFVSFKIL